MIVPTYNLKSSQDTGKGGETQAEPDRTPELR